MTRYRALTGIAAALLLTLGVACDRKAAAGAEPSEPASTAAPAAPSAPPAAASSTVDNSGPLGPGETLLGRLSKESKDRPTTKPTADDVFAAFDRLGAGVPQKEQTMAATYKAAYCVGGYTADRSLAINVCEYPSEAAATAGRDMSRGMFPDLPTRDVWRRRTTTLAIIEQKRDAATTALQKRLVDAFLAM